VHVDAQDWPELSRLLDRMLEVPPAEREDWVRALGEPDARLRPRLLELLQATTGTDAAAWFNTLPKLDDPALVTVLQSGAAAEDVGDEVGPYRLLRLLGRGGMGSVWYAERSDGLVRRGVALKLPLLAGQSRALAARFAREREIIAGLVHPNIARLYDAGIGAGGQAYLALEYVEGSALDTYCDDRRLDVRARVRLFGQVLAAAQYAHSRLVIHRDIKPANILVTGDGQVRLLDFGVAKLLAGDDADAADLTRLGGPAMTLAYAAPEQVAGRTVTTAADVYALGVVLYELLVGARPYRAKRGSPAALEEAILQGDIALPSATPDAAAAALRGTTVPRLRRALRGDLDAVLLKALARAPAARYATVEAMADDLARYLDGRAVHAHGASRGYQLRKFVGRNRYAVAAATAATLALFLALGMALWQAREAGRQAQIAAGERDAALAAALHREAVEEFMSDLLLEAGRTGKPVSVAGLIARADELSAHAFERDPGAGAAVLKTVAEFKLDIEGPEQALAVLDRAQQLLTGSPDIALRTELGCDRSLLRGLLGHEAEAAQALQAITADASLPPESLSDCYGDLAQLEIARGDGPAAARAAALGLDAWGRSARRSPIRHLELQTRAAQAQTLDGEPGKAEASYDQVIGELQHLGRDRGPRGEFVRYARFMAALDSGDLNHALALANETLSIVTLDVGDRPPPADMLYARGVAFEGLGRSRDALADFTRATRLAAASQDRSIELLARLRAARALSSLGLHERAEAQYRQALRDMDGAASGADPASRTAALLTRAWMDADARRYAAARADLDAAIQASSPASRISLATARRLRALAALALGDTDQALRDAHAALELGQALRGDKPYSAWVGEAQFTLAQVLAARGALAEARQAYRAAAVQLLPTVGKDHPALRQMQVAALALTAAAP